MQSSTCKIAGSFRDPDGFLFKDKGVLYRQINKSYKTDYELLMKSGLYKTLRKNNYLVEHSEIKNFKNISSNGYIVIKPYEISTISYPYEWSFSALYDAALVTLDIELLALSYGMTLKDASAYNIQFDKGKPIFIDTLSFEKYKEGEPWVAYRQFCQHFLGPLALASSVDIRMLYLLRDFIDGIPMDLVSKLLPKKTYLNQGLLTHIHLHARAQSHYADNKLKVTSVKQHISKNALITLLTNLRNTIKGLTFKTTKSEWGKYYTFTNYSKHAFEHKKRLVNEYLTLIKPKKVWDLGANNGEFSLLAANKKITTIAWDIDPIAIENGYNFIKETNNVYLLPLLLDLTNPSPSLGWANMERDSFMKRGPVDMIMALALIHHLSISNNVPLDDSAQFFNTLCKYLIIEFVPKSDSQVQKLLKNRKDIFTNYTLNDFENIYSKYFKIIKKTTIKDTVRTLYLLESKKI